VVGTRESGDSSKARALRGFVQRQRQMPGRIERCIMAIITGTATTPFKTALQYSALTGSMAVRFEPTPIAVAAAITA
jgi:hypothetical protein